MATRPQKAAGTKRVRRPAPPVYLGQWLSAFGVKPRELVRATGINEGYISQIISGEKKNPGLGILQEIANFLGIPRDYLHTLPPDKNFIQQAQSIDPAVLAKLQATRRH